MPGIFLQKIQSARDEFMRGKTPLQVLFSDNPGFVRSTHPIVQNVRSTVNQTSTPVVEKVKAVAPNLYAPVYPPSVVPKLLRAPSTNVSQIIPGINVSRVSPGAIVPKITEKVKAAVPAVPVPTDFFSTLARGLARVTGAKTSPPPGYHWIY